uniref:Uncharacterized protein n=1 Tax=Oryza brachyantha TaxID=4533 RepID=J3LVG7_ORYBR
MHGTTPLGSSTSYCRGSQYVPTRLPSLGRRMRPSLLFCCLAVNVVILVLHLSSCLFIIIF